MTTEEYAINELNARVEREAADLDVSPPRFRFAASRVWGTIDIVDPENDLAHIDRVPEEIVGSNPTGVLNLLNRNRTQAYMQGERYGRWAAQSDVLRALGVEDVVLWAREGMARDDLRDRADFKPEGAR